MAEKAKSALTAPQAQGSLSFPEHSKWLPRDHGAELLDGLLYPLVLPPTEAVERMDQVAVQALDGGARCACH